jgi:hypothetical protein
MEPTAKRFVGKGSGSAPVGSGGSLSSNMAKGGSEIGILGGGPSSFVNIQSGTSKGSP